MTGQTRPSRAETYVPENKKQTDKEQVKLINNQEMKVKERSAKVEFFPSKRTRKIDARRNFENKHAFQNF